jgi:DNA mismatch repair protein MutH
MSSRPDAAVLALDQGTTGSTAFVFGPEGEVLDVVPRGFYLRARFTEMILWS